MKESSLGGIFSSQLTRRTLLKGTLIGGAGLVVAPSISGTTKTGSPTLKKYLNPLAVPAVAQPTQIEDGVAQYRIAMTQFRGKVHRDLPPTTLWGYDGAWPGPTFEARTGKPISIQWVNDLPRRPRGALRSNRRLHWRGREVVQARQ